MSNKFNSFRNIRENNINFDLFVMNKFLHRRYYKNVSYMLYMTCGVFKENTIYIDNDLKTLNIYNFYNSYLKNYF